MKPDHDLFGLLEYAAKDKWKGRLEDALGDHFGEAMVEFEIEQEEMFELLGEQWAVTLIGCAFEDLLTREFEPDGANLADDYLKRRGWKETPAVRAYIRALRRSLVSLYEVSEVNPGRSFLARDLIRGGEPLLVSERSATQTLRAWDRIAARIVQMGEKRILSGGVLPLTLKAADAVVEGLRKAISKRSRRAKLAIGDETLRGLAPMFTTVWLLDMLPKAMGDDVPRLHNSDGDEIVFHEVRFPLAPRVTHKAVASRLDTLAELRKENDGSWNWVGGRDARTSKTSQHDSGRWNSAIDDGAVLFGGIELKERIVQLSVNSAARAARGTAMLEGALAELVRTPLTSIQTVDQARQSVGDAPPSEVEPEVAASLIHVMLDKYYRGLLDEPVPMLGNRTPRQAAATPAGRKQLVAWLQLLENGAGLRVDPADPIATYSFGWMWRELGVEDLRR